MKLKYAKKQAVLQTSSLDGIIGENRIAANGLPIRSNITAGHDCWYDENGKKHCSYGL